MTQETLNNLASEYSAGESPLDKSQAENVAYQAGFKKALKLVCNKLNSMNGPATLAALIVEQEFYDITGYIISN